MYYLVSWVVKSQKVVTPPAPIISFEKIVHLFNTHLQLQCLLSNPILGNLSFVKQLFVKLSMSLTSFKRLSRLYVLHLLPLFGEYKYLSRLPTVLT